MFCNLYEWIDVMRRAKLRVAEFDGLVNDFDKLESRMRKLIRLQRQKQSRSLTQLTLHDYFH
jgi:hypothetical protein